MNKEKILFAINDFRTGGAQKLVADQINFIDKNKYEIHVMTFMSYDKKTGFWNHITDKGVVFHEYHFKSLFDFSSYKLVADAIKELAPAIIFSHLFLSNFITRITFLFHKSKIVTVEHNTYKARAWKYVIADKILAKFSSRIIAVSEEVKLYSSSQIGISTDKYIVITNAMDVESVTTEKSKELLLKELHLPNARYLINVARIVKQKNHLGLIKGYEAFLQKNKETDLHLIIVGDGIMKKELDEYVQTNRLDSNIHLVGLQQDVISYLFASECFISTSFIEGLSVAYVEALAAGLPIISTKSAGTEELITDGWNGFYVTENNSEGIVAAIEKYEQSNKKQMSYNAAIRAKTFSIDKSVSRYLELI